VAGRVGITTAPLNITASSGSFTYGGTVPTITASYSGFVNSESATNLTTQPTCSTTATSSSPASPPTYASTCTGAVDSNYTIGYVAGTVTVNPAPLTITANSSNKTYGQAVTFNGTEFTPSGLLNSDKVTSVTLTSAGAAGNATVGTYSIVPSVALGSGLSNYNITYVNGTLTVTKATPIVTWTNPANITYGTALSSIQLNATFTWVVSGSTQNVAGTATYSPASGTVLNPGAGQILSVSFAPSDTADYNVPPTKTVTINVLFASASSGLCDGDLSHTILQPIHADGTSVFKTGSTVPTKFRVCDAFGNSVGPTTAFPNVVKSYNIVGTYGGTITNVDESVSSTTPDIAFRWDPTAQQWIFNTATGAGTSLSSKNVTYLFQIVLIDGTIIGSSGTGGVIPSAPFVGYNGYQYGLK
jgi:hypothetical protein